MIATISPAELAALRASGKPVRLIDVRTPVEFRELHVDFAENVPLDRLEPGQFKTAVGAPLYVICRSGNRGQQACEKLATAGLCAVNVAGGTLAWDAAGLPVVRGQKAISLERQVRIVAGFLTLFGAILAIAVHPYFAGLSAFVGAGLMFSAITDTCGMALVLARMPWNQIAADPAASSCRIPR